MTPVCKRSAIIWALALIALPYVSAYAAPAIDPAFCQAWTRHTPDADVTYQPGVDAYGRAVAPADLDGSAGAAPPMAFHIPLTLDLLTVLGIKATDFPFNAMGRNDINLGDLTVKGDQVLLNGKPLSDAQQDKLSVLCLEPRGGHTAPTKITP